MIRVWFLAATLGLCLLAVPTFLSAADDRAEYEIKLADVSKQESDALVDLASWAKDKELPDQAYRLATQVLTIQPKNDAARNVIDQLPGDAWRAKTYNIELILKDGSQLRGSAELRQVTLNSEFGTLCFPIKNVAIVVFDFVDKNDIVVADGFTMIGAASVGSFPMDTKVGHVIVDGASIKQMRLVRPCEACAGKGKVFCTNCQGKGIMEIKKVCPTCKGVDSKKVCATCNGKGTIVCDACDGRGSWHISRGGIGRDFVCPKCHGKGELTCPDCNGKGGTTCPTCKGLGYLLESGPCPVCGGTKLAPCSVCHGTGERPSPKPVWPLTAAAPADTTAPTTTETP